MRQGDQQHVARLEQQIGRAQAAFALARASLAEREQAAEAPPAFAVHGQRRDIRRRLFEHEPRADDEPEGGRAFHDLGDSHLQRLGGHMADRADAGGLPDRRAGRQAVLAQRLQGAMGAHHAGDGVAVANAEPGKARLQGRGDHLGGRGGSAQEGKVRCGDEIGEASHANTPCNRQRGWSFRSS